MGEIGCLVSHMGVSKVGFGLEKWKFVVYKVKFD